MCKKSHFRGQFDKWHGKRGKTLLKSEPQHLYHIYWSFWRSLRLKKSLWVIFKILGLFNNPLTADDKYSLLNRGNLLQHFQMHISQKRKTFSHFFFFFFFFLRLFNLDSMLNIFRKRMTLIGDVFLNVGTPKNVVT